MDYQTVIKAPISAELADFIEMFNRSLDHEDGILTQFTPPGLYPLSNDKMVEINCYLPTMVADNLKSDVIKNYDGEPLPQVQA